jgi:ribosomal protein L14
MLHKGSFCSVIDKNGIQQVGIFHLYGGFFRKYSFFGSFLKVSVKKVSPSYLVLKKSKFKAISILTIFKQFKKDGSIIFFKTNSLVILKRRLTPLGREIVGPTNYNIFRKRFLFSFSIII